MLQWTQTHGSPFDFHYRANCNDDEKVHHCPQYDTHSQPASQPGCCMYPVKVRKTYKVFCHSGGFEGWLNIVLMYFYKFNSVITINIVIDRLNWVKRLYSTVEHGHKITKKFLSEHKVITQEQFLCIISWFFMHLK